MKFLVKNILIFTLLLLALPAMAEIIIIVHPDNPIESLTKKQVRRIFLGKTTIFEDGSPITAIDQKSESKIWTEFQKTMLNKTPAQAKTYWSIQIFTGRGVPPIEMQNTRSVIEVVSQNEEAIGYIDSKHVKSTVKVVPIK